VGQTGANQTEANGELVNPCHIVTVMDFSPATLRSIVAHLERSTSFEHLVYREAELDAVWSISGFLLSTAQSPAERAALMRLHYVAHQAHDLVGMSRPVEAADLLRTLL